MNIYLVRHGETDWNLEMRIQGQTDVPLNDTGRRQARQIKYFFQDLLIQAIYTSRLIRAIETAEIITAGNLHITVCKDLDERNFGDWQKRLWKEIHEENPSLHQKWQNEAEYFRPPNGESLLEMYSRSYSVFKQIVRMHTENDQIIIVCHGGSIKGILGRVQGIPDFKIPNAFHLDNCSISKINYNGGFHVEFINYTS